ncbi:MAG: low molecular weight phosphotyrosine protein phosphatase, partial [Anaerolineae bacterium]|nr:low molecular weight phosphotyrosine protein phosphatase [Anaerolineae bacterium]
AGLSDAITVDSAGTGSWHVGEKAHSGTRNILRQHNIRYDGRARQVTRADFGNFDYILAMDGSNLSNLQRMIPDDSDAVVKRFLEFAEGEAVRDVPDPYYNNRFEEVYTLVKAAAEGLLKYLREEHDL